MKVKGYEMNRLRLEFENQSRNRRYKKIKNKNKEQLRSVVSKTNDLKGGNYYFFKVFRGWKDREGHM